MTELAPDWYELVVNDESLLYETLEELNREKAEFISKGCHVDDQSYKQRCIPPGEYLVADPAKVLKDWESGKGVKYPLENDVYILEDGTVFALYQAENGPGVYSNDGYRGVNFSIATESGYILIYPCEDTGIGDGEPYEEDESSNLIFAVSDELVVKGMAEVLIFDLPADTALDRQCQGCIDIGSIYLLTGDDSLD